MTHEPQQPDTTKAAWNRRFKYGTNVSVLLIAVLAIVLLVNWMAADKVREMGINARFDFTATRKYTLSPQTRKLLNQMDADVRITTMFAGGMSADEVRKISAFRDLLDEYEMRSAGAVEVVHLDPVTDIERIEELTGELRKRYADELDPARHAIEQGIATLNQLKAFAAERGPWFKTTGIAARETVNDQQLKQTLSQVILLVEQLPAWLQIDGRLEQVANAQGEMMPNYAAIRSALRTPLEQARDQLFSPGAELFDQITRSTAVSDELAQFAGQAKPLFDQQTAQLDRAIQSLEAIDTTRYSAVRNNIAQANSVLIEAGDGLSVIRLGDVYTDPMVSAEGEAVSEQRFRGEEAVTGAIISLTMQARPLVVFVTGQQPALGSQGDYSHVAERLTNMNFKVKQWAPAGRQSQFGPAPPEQRPEPEAGQPVVWVFTPAPPPDPRLPYNPAKKQIDAKFKELLAEGQNVLAFLELSPMVRFGTPDEMAESIREAFGVTPETGLQIVTEMVTPDGRAVPVPQLEINDWPTEHPIAAAVGGQTGVLLNALPIQVEQTEGVATWPLIETGEDTWADRDAGMTRNPTRDDDEQRGPFTAGVAIEKGEQRAVIIGDGLFANDGVTTAGPVDPFTGASGPQYFPANAELFTNSIYWLTDMDVLIATGARTQDVRRIEKIPDRAMTAMWWVVLAGLPLGTLAVGTGVWLARRG